MPSDESIAVLFVDDNPDLGALFAAAAGREPDIECVGTLTDANDLVAEVGQKKPQIVLLDLTMPGADPLTALREVHRTHPETRVIVFSGYDDADTVDEAVEAGAWGFVSKHQDMTAVFKAVRQVAAGEMAMGA